MRRLWMLRHAKSSWDDPGLADHDRPLADRGRRAAEAMAGYLEREEIRPGLVVCSSARRARETLAAVLPSLGAELTIRVDPALYTFSGSQLLETVLELPDDHAEVLLVGHNPAMEDLVATLAGGGDRLASLQEKFPTAALAGLDLAIENWGDAARGSALLTTFVTPRELT
jgi:phosphohistidine phosphatase